MRALEPVAATNPKNGRTTVTIGNTVQSKTQSKDAISDAFNNFAFQPVTSSTSRVDEDDEPFTVEGAMESLDVDDINLVEDTLGVVEKLLER